MINNYPYVETTSSISEADNYLRPKDCSAKPSDYLTAEDLGHPPMGYLALSALTSRVDSKDNDYQTTHQVATENTHPPIKPVENEPIYERIDNEENPYDEVVPPPRPTNDFSVIPERHLKRKTINKRMKWLIGIGVIAFAVIILSLLLIFRGKSKMRLLFILKDTYLKANNFGGNNSRFTLENVELQKPMLVTILAIKILYRVKK